MAEAKQSSRRNWVIGGVVVVAVILIIGFASERRKGKERLDRQIDEAAETGDFAAVRRLLEEGANPDGQDVYHRSPLLFAARAGEDEVVQALIDAGADPERGGLLQTAIRRGDVEGYRRWLEAGLDPNAPAPMGFDYNVLQVISDTIWRSDLETDKGLEMAKLGIEHGADVNRHGMHGFTPLIVAVSNQQVAMVRLLLENGVEIGLTDERGWDAMDTAAFRENEALISLLAEHGAEISIQEAVSIGDQDRVTQLVAADPTCIERQCIGGNRPLGLALKHGHLETARFLIDRGAELKVRNEEGETLLHLAARGELPEMVTLLLGRGLDVNAKAHGGETPLHETTYTDCAGAARVLIEAGAEIDAQNSSQITPLVWASGYDSSRVLKLLVAAGADPNGLEGGMIPLHSACHYSRTDRVPASVVALVEAGADVNRRTASGRTALHWAVEWFGGVPLVTYLLEQGADPSIVDGSGMTALDLARGEGKQALVELLGGQPGAGGGAKNPEAETTDDG